MAYTPAKHERLIAPAGRRIERPEDLEQMSVKQMLAAIRPLLQVGGLAAHPDARRRHEDNVLGALVEVREQWNLERQPKPFADFVRLRLRITLIHMDAEQHPELYDGKRGRYCPDRAAESLSVPRVQHLAERQGAADEPAAVPLTAAMHSGGIAQASQLPVLQLVDDVRTGKIANGRCARAAVGAPGQGTAILHAARAVAEGDRSWGALNGVSFER